MIVSFTTRKGHKYHIDHKNKQFVQELPFERCGPLWNTPTVQVGKPVELWTEGSDGKAAKVIITGPVKTREVTLEATY